MLWSVRVSNSLDPADQARNIVRPDLGPNCLQRLDDNSRYLNYFLASGDFCRLLWLDPDKD